MNRFSPAPNAYTRPQVFGVAGFGQPTSTYGLNQQWPAATSTELWSQQNVAQFQTNQNQNQWTPALPISNNLNLIQTTGYTTSWNPNMAPNRNDSNKK